MFSSSLFLLSLCLLQDESHRLS